MPKLLSVEGHRWAIVDSFESTKNELGLDHNETRSLHGWHRHVSLVMLAFAMMAVIRHRTVAQKNAAAASTEASFLIRWLIQKSAASPSGLPSGASRTPTSSYSRPGAGLIGQRSQVHRGSKNCNRNASDLLP